MNPSTFIPLRASLSSRGLRFETGDLRAALLDGCFALRIPADVDVAPGIRLAKQFYLPAAHDEEDRVEDRRYRGYRQKHEIYFDRENFQTEHVLIDEPGRRNAFPSEVNVLSDKMHAIASQVLAEILDEANVSEPLRPVVTDRCIEGRGVRWFAVNHYRPERSRPGAPAHKDTGFVTVLFCDQPGLEVRIDGRWRDVEAVPGHFLVNFGGSLELLLERTPVSAAAVLHRVRQSGADPIRGDRFSFAAFLNPGADRDLYQMAPDGQNAYAVESVGVFLRRFNAETWQDDHADFGIAAADTANVRTEA